jgi:hypothetical protein
MRRFVFALLGGLVLSVRFPPLHSPPTRASGFLHQLPCPHRQRRQPGGNRSHQCRQRHVHSERRVLAGGIARANAIERRLRRTT